MKRMAAIRGSYRRSMAQHTDAEAAKAELFRRYPDGLTLRLWDGTSIRAGAESGRDSPFTLVFRTPEAVWSAVLGRDPLALADAYFRGDVAKVAYCKAASTDEM